MILKYEIVYKALFANKKGILTLDMNNNCFTGVLVLDEKEYNVKGSTDGENFTLDYSKNYWIGKFLDKTLVAEEFSGYGNHKIEGNLIIA